MSSINRPLELAETVGTFVFSAEETNKIISEIGKRVKRYRMKYNFSIEKLASITGIAKGTIYKIEKGKSQIGLKSLLKLCYAMQIPLDTMVPLINKSDMQISFGDKIDNAWNNLEETERNCIINFMRMFINTNTVNSVSRGKRSETP